MTSSPFQDAVAIDTNVFMHLLNPHENVGSHINKLLEYLQAQDAHLIIDSNNRILGEYNHHIAPIIVKNDDTRNEIYILRYWILNAPRSIAKVVGNDQLMSEIKQVIIEPKEAVDRIFVYVALKQGRVLVTNDRLNIVHGPQSESTPRRHRLMRTTRKLRPNGANILTSQEASAMT